MIYVQIGLNREQDCDSIKSKLQNWDLKGMELGDFKCKDTRKTLATGFSALILSVSDRSMWWIQRLKHDSIERRPESAVQLNLLISIILEAVRLPIWRRKPSSAARGSRRPLSALSSKLQSSPLLVGALLAVHTLSLSLAPLSSSPIVVLKWSYESCSIENCSQRNRKNG